MAKKDTTEKPSKSEVMATFKEAYDKIEIAKAALADLEEEASAAGAEVVKYYDKGPHKMIDAEGRTLVVQFKKVQHKIRFETMDFSAIE